jgi:hypothetical protein
MPLRLDEETQALRVWFANLQGGIDARDPVEGMLAPQMIATHQAAMECLRRSALQEQTSEGRDLNLKNATRLMSLYERQMAALDKHRGRGQQNVTVKHVHVAEGGQAIVGNVAHADKAMTADAGTPPALEVQHPVALVTEAARIKAGARL